MCRGRRAALSTFSAGASRHLGVVGQRRPALDFGQRVLLKPPPFRCLDRIPVWPRRSAANATVRSSPADRARTESSYLVRTRRRIHHIAPDRHEQEADHCSGSLAGCVADRGRQRQLTSGTAPMRSDQSISQARNRRPQPASWTGSDPPRLGSSWWTTSSRSAGEEPTTGAT